MHNLKKTAVLFNFLTVFVLLLNCHKENFITDGNAELRFSTDTVTFDTIFTTIGSVTKYFKIYNPHNRPIKISSIYLAGGDNSNFRLNIDNTGRNQLEDVEIPEKDSLFLFIEAFLNPTNSNEPLVIKDSVIFITNGNEQNVKLVAFGQDVHFFSNDILQTQTWTSDKPYLIYKNTAVDSGAVLTIEEGVQVYLHNYADLRIFGQLIINGTRENPVVFTGDRLEEEYKNAAGRWMAIYIHPSSRDNHINYAIIKNPVVGIQIGNNNYEGIPSLEISNTIIQNSVYYGISAVGAELTVYNSVLADCLLNNIGLWMGGNYNFYHCTLSNLGAFNGYRYESRSAKIPSLILSNSITGYELNYLTFEVDTVEYYGNMNANFHNCIIYGTLDDEIVVDKDPDYEMDYFFDHCMLTLKNENDSFDLDNNYLFNEVIYNRDTLFINNSLYEGEYDFHPDTLSPVKDKGTSNIITLYPFLEYDYDGNSRLEDDAPDMGAFERME